MDYFIILGVFSSCPLQNTTVASVPFSSLALQLHIPPLIPFYCLISENAKGPMLILVMTALVPWLATSTGKCILHLSDFLTELQDYVLNWAFSPKWYNKSFKILSALLYMEIKGNGSGQMLCIDFFHLYPTHTATHVQFLNKSENFTRFWPVLTTFAI